MVESGFNPLGTGSLLAAGFGFMVDVANVDWLAGRRRGGEVFRRKQAFWQPVRRQSERLPECAFERVSAPVTKPHSRTDAGTIILQWISAIVVLTSIAGLTLFFSSAPYPLHIRRSGLRRRRRTGWVCGFRGYNAGAIWL